MNELRLPFEFDVLIRCEAETDLSSALIDCVFEGLPVLQSLLRAESLIHLTDLFLSFEVQLPR